MSHDAGVVSMGRYADPNSATSSFSFLLGASPHLDMKYAIFGKVRGAPHDDRHHT
jgi:cyclophilin family peptidyl-prolyl cis-trans isomerase